MAKDINFDTKDRGAEQDSPNIEWQVARRRKGKIILKNWGNSSNQSYFWIEPLTGIEHCVCWSGSDAVEAQRWLSSQLSSK